MKLLNMLVFLVVLLPIFTSCKKGSDAVVTSVPAAASSLTAKEIAIDNATQVSLVQNIKSRSLFDVLVPQAMASIFSNMQPYFAPYLQTITLRDNKYDCANMDNSQNGIFCTGSQNDGVLASLNHDQIKDNITIYPRISSVSQTHNPATATTNEASTVAYLVEDKYYHLVVGRLKGGKAQQSVTVDVIDGSGNVIASANSADMITACGFSIINAGQASLVNGDIILKTEDINANSGNYYEPNCKFRISGTFSGISIPASIGKLISLKGILDEDTSGVGTFPQISSVKFEGQDVTSSEITIYLDQFQSKSDGYKYGDWEIVQPVGGASTAILKTFWMFTCGGGGSDKWIYKNAATVADTTTATSYSNLSITDIDTDTYADPIFDASAAYAGVPVFTPKKYHWQVGSCNEMLMLVSAIDNNGVMSQKKVAILSR